MFIYIVFLLIEGHQFHSVKPWKDQLEWKCNHSVAEAFDDAGKGKSKGAVFTIHTAILGQQCWMEPISWPDPPAEMHKVSKGYALFHYMICYIQT